MPYSGETFDIKCNVGGWNANPNIDTIPPSAMVEVENLNLNKGGRGTRGGVDVVNGTVISGAPQVMGAYQFRLKNGSTFIVTATNDGKIQKDYTTTVLKTGLTVDKYSLFETFEDVLYVCNGADVPETWNGAAATTTTLVAIPTDWATTNQPKQMIKHGRGASERLWAFGCPLNPERIYASDNGAADFTDAKVIQINIETSDGFGIVAGIEYGDRIFFFGKRNAYIIDDTDTDATKWGYEAAQWEGGAAHERLVCKTPNDVVVVTEDLDIYSLTAVQSYGDYKAASLIKSAHIDNWITSNVDKAQINKFHIIYDPELRAVKLFVVRIGQIQIDTCLVFFVDLGAENGWSKHKYASTKFASCSTLVRVSAGSWKVYTGGYNGFVYQLETATFNDDGVAYYNGFTTPYIDMENPRTLKRFDRLWLTIVPQATETISANFLIDGVLYGYLIVDESGNYLVDESGYYIIGNFYSTISASVTASLITAIQTYSALQDLSTRLGKTGRRIQIEIYNNVINTGFFISQLLIDFISLGPKAK